MSERFANGGPIPSRPGDSIPVRVSEGCFWVPAEAVRQYGAEFLARMNGTDHE